MKGKSRRRGRSCWEAARSRARQARRKGMSPFLVALAFVLAFLSLSSSRRHLGSGDDWPITDYERGVSRPLKRQRDGAGSDRYIARPTMRRLMRDLRRPAARAHAEQALLARLPDDDLREWVSYQIGKDRISRLSVYAREGLRDGAVVDAWRAELDAERAAKAEAADEAREQAHAIRAVSMLIRKEATGTTGLSR